MSVTELFPAGRMTVGCNYWASHAGIRMWSDWDENTVAGDLDVLAGQGFRYLRVFPLWSDFQPLEVLYTYQSIPYEISFRGGPFPDTPAGRAGVDEVMVERLRRFLDLAHQRGIRVSIGLVTGWMSGRLFAPAAFAGRSLLTDAEAVHWQVRMIRCLVGEFHRHPALASWGPGNECNAAGKADREQAWWWLSTVTGAIRSIDREHPIASGMHSLIAGHPHRYLDQAGWLISDQTELVDYYTTHPYPLFTPHAGRDGIASFRSAWHAAGEGCLYADLGQKPCFSEELGTLAPMIGDDRAKMLYLRKVLLNLWTHDNRALVWWCAFDQDKLDYAPYEWNAVERQLGLFTGDRAPKPFVKVFAEALARIDALHPEPLPPRRTGAVVLTSCYQDAWGNAWGAFLLAKRAGFDVSFANAAEPLPESNCYILPGLAGDQSISRRRYLELLDKVRAGATLYISFDDGILAPFNDVFGFESLGLADRREPAEFEFAGHTFRLAGPRRLLIGRLEERALSLAREADGNAVWLESRLGKGKIFLSTLPVEKAVTGTAGALEEHPWHLWYRHLAAEVLAALPVRSAEPAVNLTLHPVSETEVTVIAVNNGSIPAPLELAVAPGWEIAAIRGESQLEPGDGAFIKLICRK